MATYSTVGDPATLNAPELAGKLRSALAAASPRLASFTEQEAAASAPGKWTPKQVLGHLCDSAMNNQQRIVRLQLQPTLELPGYEQESWVRVQRYDLRSWHEVLTLWLTLNHHLAHTVEHLYPAALTHTWLCNGSPLTLGFLIEDYIGHLQHHLRALLR